MKTINRSRLWEKVGSFTRFGGCDGYTHMFIYPMSGRNVLLKGGRVDLVDFATKTIDEPYINHRVIFHKGKSRTIISAENFPEGIKAYFHNNTIIVFNGDKMVFEKKVKRIPRKFPRELKTILEGQNI